MAEQTHILVVDDEPQIRTMLRRYLTDEGFKVSEAADGAGLRAAFAAGGVDLVLLDLMMPGEDGLSLAREIRRQSETPIIMLTGKSDLIDRVVGLEAGADDYVAKPFHLREILARIRTVLRRAPSGGAATPKLATPAETAEDGVLFFDDWQFDTTKRELHNPDGRQVDLTTAEFELLRAFVTHANRVLSREQLMDLVKGREWAAYDRAIDTQIVRLRKKVELGHGKPELIKTVRGAGYMFAAHVTKR